MLKTTYEHFYGSQERHSLELVKLSLDTTDLDEKEALDNGWLLSANKWYPCRSVRLEVTKFNTEDLPFQTEIEEIRPSCVFSIYKDYIEYKGFRSLDSDFLYEDDRTRWLILSDQGVPVAFTKFQLYAGGLESQFNAWNYHKPRLSIGKRMLSLEIAHARELGLDYLYIGAGYETGGIYKAELQGFQWWTGSEWSTDKEYYRDLCIRDSNIKTLYELSDIYNG